MNVRAVSSLVVALVLTTIATTAPAGDEVVLGQTLDLTGPSANIGRALKLGREACLAQANQRAPAGHKPMRIVTFDDHGDAAVALVNARQLAESAHAIGLLGPMGAAANAAVLPWATHTRMGVIGPFGGDVESRIKDWDSAFFLTANQSAEALRLSAHVKSLGARRVVIVHATDSAGRAALTAFEEALGVVEIPPVREVAVDGTAKGATAAVTAVLSEGADAVLLATSGEQTASLLRAFNSAGRSGAPLQIYGLSSALSLADLRTLGDVAEGFAMSEVLPSPREASLPVIAAFRQAVGGRESDASYVELEGCITSMVAAQVLQRKGTQPTKAGFLSALQNTGVVRLGGFQVDLDDRSGAARFTDIVFVTGGGRTVR